MRPVPITPARSCFEVRLASTGERLAPRVTADDDPLAAIVCHYPLTTVVFGVVVPFLNEERYLPTLLESLAAQSDPVDQLLLVDDGSTDASPRIAAEFARAHDYAVVLRRPPRRLESDRLATAAELVAAQWAVERLEEPWDVLGKVDADVWLAPETIAEIRHAFESDPALGMAGAHLSEPGKDSGPVRKPCGPGHVEGATKFYRRRCWEEISPLPPILGWDIIDELRAQMRGWKTASLAIPGGDPVHLRPMGAHDGALRAHRRWGTGAYAYGEHPLHLALVATRDARRPPVLFGSLNFVLGWALAALQRAPRAEPELRAYNRREQLRRIRRRLDPLRPRPGSSRAS
jgi:poly-beta-1,6-N-acetyl-D-glucosamine synthase